MQNQASEDHRGTPEAPGRVVTLIDRAHYDTLVDHHYSAPDERVWGAAYHIPAEHDEEVRSYLDIREINGYSIQYTPFHPAHGSESMSASKNKQLEPINCLVYIGMPDNAQFLGPQDPQQLAAHILRSTGPSGPNREYLYMLDEALLSLSPESRDGHISDLTWRAKALEAGGGWEGNEGPAGPARPAGPAGPELHRVGSTEEQEEMEKEG
ncbi:ChaC-like protein [Venturia nashicola]|uniref:glutathione-specific gamma-glutamylcyclotransferase n=1 Tax=Venturia nashicola TaxID=86259 RepID=A0A4Z1NL91_9PEZI|nr:ChaC-like protein [Venturia nashicola]